MPGHLVGQTRDGGEQGVGFGAPAESERPEPQDFLPLQQYRLRRSLAISFLHAMNVSFVASVGGIVLLDGASVLVDVVDVSAKFNPVF